MHVILGVDHYMEYSHDLPTARVPSAAAPSMTCESWFLFLEHWLPVRHLIWQEPILRDYRISQFLQFRGQFLLPLIVQESLCPVPG